ncbi:MAG TPA: hypothetical protein VFH97_01495 [Gemmatimonadales bacterium]|nr:hypothetical protein [Gemmatimonadales bacterium]
MEDERRHSLDPIREALKAFEAAVVDREKISLVESRVLRQQAVDRARERVIEEIMSLTRRTIAEREAARSKG